MRPRLTRLKGFTRLTVRKKLWLAVFGILILTVFAGVVDYPKGPDIHWPLNSSSNLIKEIKVHLGLDLQGGTSLTYSADTSQVPVAQQADAMAGVQQVLENRINAFGVSEPLIQTTHQSNAWQVLVQLPGITNINDAIKQIGETPLLQFKTEAPAAPLTDDQKKLIDQLNQSYLKKAQDTLDQLNKGGDFAALAKSSSQDTTTATTGGEMGYVAKSSLDTAIADTVFKADKDKVISQVLETSNDYEIIKVEDHSTGNLNTLNKVPASSDTNSNTNTAPVEAVKYARITFQKLPYSPDVFGPNYVTTELTGKQLKSAQVQFDPTTNAPLVALTFNDEGAKLFEKITKDNLNKTIAIFLDDKAISTPVVNQVITGGQAVIQGKFTLDEAKQLAQKLSAGALPVKIQLVNEQNIGPTLGADALQRSVLAGVLAMVILGIFMVVFYRWPGFIAMIALTIYGLLLLAIFKLWPITLTLSGIAGFILSLGMAVDANVLIFERFKEELRNGKALQSAIDDGFKRAWLSIRDSNVSSLITCFILSWFGTAMIKGFAVTLAIGIVLSLFSAITITRTLLKVFPVKNNWLYGVKKDNNSKEHV